MTGYAVQSILPFGRPRQPDSTPQSAGRPAFLLRAYTAKEVVSYGVQCRPNTIPSSIDRPVIKWPNNARVAFWVAPNIEHLEYEPFFDGVRNPWPRTSYPDVQQYSYRDYSNRIAIWRMLDVFDKYNVKCGISINMGVLDHFPEITRAFVDRGYDFTSHGWYNTAYLTSVGEEEERKFYQDQIATLKRTTGKTLKGMLRPRHLGDGAHPRPDGRSGPLLLLRPSAA